MTADSSHLTKSCVVGLVWLLANYEAKHLVQVCLLCSCGARTWEDATCSIGSSRSSVLHIKGVASSIDGFPLVVFYDRQASTSKVISPNTTLVTKNTQKRF